MLGILIRLMRTPGFLTFFPLIPLAIFVAFFVLGWFLELEILRIVWLSLSGFLVVLTLAIWISIAITFYRMTRFIRTL